MQGRGYTWVDGDLRSISISLTRDCGHAEALTTPLLSQLRSMRLSAVSPSVPLHTDNQLHDTSLLSTMDPAGNSRLLDNHAESQACRLVPSMLVPKYA